MRRQIELFFAALGFFTRIPVPRWIAWSPEHMHDCVRYLPLIGWVVGSAGAAVFLLTLQILPAAVAVLLALIAMARLTGAIHEDGFADVCDGFGAGWERSQILAIMKDSHIGVYGVLGLILLLLTKTAALTALASQSVSAAAIALLIAHPFSRLAAVCVLHTLDYARTDGPSKARPLAHRLPRSGLAMAAVTGLAPLALLLSEPAAIASVLAIVAAFTVWAVRSLYRRLGGYTGDCLGAVQQAAELLCYLGILAVWNSI